MEIVNRCKKIEENSSSSKDHDIWLKKIWHSSLQVASQLRRDIIIGNIFSSFFKERKIDAKCNTSGFIFFETLLNFLWIFKQVVS